MKEVKLVWLSLAQAVGTLIYIFIVAIFLYYSDSIVNQTPTFLAPVAYLLLLVVSATIVGSIVLGKSLTMYLDGEKKSAVKLLFYTVAWLLIVTMIVLLIAMI